MLAGAPASGFVADQLSRFTVATQRDSRQARPGREESKGAPSRSEGDPDPEEAKEPSRAPRHSGTGDVLQGRATGATGGTYGLPGEERSVTTSLTNQHDAPGEIISTPPPPPPPEETAVRLKLGSYAPDEGGEPGFRKTQTMKASPSSSSSPSAPPARGSPAKGAFSKSLLLVGQQAQAAGPSLFGPGAREEEGGSPLRRSQTSRAGVGAGAGGRFAPRRSFLDPNNELIDAVEKKEHAGGGAEKEIPVVTAGQEVGGGGGGGKGPSLSSAFLFEKNAREAHGGRTHAIGNREIHNFIALSTQQSSFQHVWAVLVAVGHTYNFVTFFFFLGNRGFPAGFWLFSEILFELLLLFDLLLRVCIRHLDRPTWRTLWLLHLPPHAVSWPRRALSTLASLPQSLVLVLALGRDEAALGLFGVALVRGAKLARMGEVSIYFKNVSLVHRRKKASYASSVFVLYFLLLATHVISMGWMVAGRLERERPAWFEQLALQTAPLYQQYVDSTFFVVATMTGLGYGNIVPRTTVEYLTVLAIMIVGASIYANFFANFAVTIYNNNEAQILNAKKLEQAKGFAHRRGLQEPLRAKLRYYYNHLALKLGALRERWDLLKELPLSLRTELALYTNADLIQSVKLFQLSEPGFILTMARELNPSLCLAADFVLHTGQLAEHLFFIKRGVVVVLAAPDETQIIAYQGAGEYFGEIGLLLPEGAGKRTAAVKALTTSVFYSVAKAPLLAILERFPFQRRFLQAVAKQRLETSSVADLERLEDEQHERDQQQQQRRARLTPRWDQEGEGEGEQEGEGEPAVGACSGPQPYSPRGKKLSGGDNGLLGRFEKGRTVRAREMIDSGLLSSVAARRRVACHLTKRYSDLRYFVLIPLSRLFYVWSAVLSAAFLYNLFYVPFSIAFQVHAPDWLVGVDLLVLGVYVADIPLRLRLAYNSATNSVETDLKEVKALYYRKYLIWEVLAVLPLDYLLWALARAGRLSPDYAAWARVLRLIKFWRFRESVALTVRLSSWKLAQWTIVKLVFFYAVISHLMGCLYYLVGRVEHDLQQRYDGQTMFADINNRDFVSNLAPFLEQPVAARYVHLVYLSACTMGACIYGDIIPLAVGEQLYTFVAMFTARIFLAFLYAEAASYLIRIHSSYAAHLKKLASVRKWMRYHKVGRPIAARVLRYQDILWHNYRGIDEETILADLPATVRSETAFALFRELVENTNIFPRDDKGSLLTLMSRLRLKLYPKDEYVVREGDVGREMFFLLKGRVAVQIQGRQVAVLSKGMALGEMALLGALSVRSASARCLTTVSLAILSREDFQLIAQHYPRFRRHLEQVVARRKRHNEQMQRSPPAPDELLTQRSERRRVSLLPPALPARGPRFSLGGASEEETNALMEGAGPVAVRRDKKFHLRKGREQPEIVVEEAPAEEEHSEEGGAGAGRGAGSSSSPAHSRKIKRRIEAVLRDSLAEDSEESVPAQGQGQARRKSQTSESSGKRGSLVLGLLEDDPLKYVRAARRVSDFPAPASALAGRDLPGARSAIMDYGSVLTRAIVEAEGAGAGAEGGAEGGGGSPDASLLQQLTGPARKKRRVRAGQIFSIALLPVSVYNLVFTPLQFAFRVEYRGAFLALELVTLAGYLAHLLLHMLVFVKAWKAEGRARDDEGGAGAGGRYTFRRQITRTFSTVVIPAQASRLGALRVKLSLDIVALLPFGIVLQSLEVHSPLLVVALLKLLRLAKVAPLLRAVAFLKARAVNITRIVEVVLSYYAVVHVLTCVWVMLGRWADDLDQSWIRRVPVPLEAGHRAGAQLADLSDLGAGTVYAHALLFMVNTVSHVAIGDVTAVTVSERAFNALVIWFGTFFYALLFGNIAAMVADFAPQLFYEFQEKQRYVASRIPEARVAESVRHRIKEYFDYRWNTQQGIDDAFVEKLPRTLRTDVLLSRFQHALRRSLLFLADEAFHPAAPPHAAPPVDYTVAAAVFNVLRLRTFMKNDFVSWCRRARTGAPRCSCWRGTPPCSGWAGASSASCCRARTSTRRAPTTPSAAAWSRWSPAPCSRWACSRARTASSCSPCTPSGARASSSSSACSTSRRAPSSSRPRSRRAATPPRCGTCARCSSRATRSPRRSSAAPCSRSCGGGERGRGGVARSPKRPSPSPSTSWRTCGSRCWRRTRRRRRTRPRPRRRRARRGCGSWCRGGARWTRSSRAGGEGERAGGGATAGWRAGAGRGAAPSPRATRSSSTSARASATASSRRSARRASASTGCTSRSSCTPRSRCPSWWASACRWGRRWWRSSCSCWRRTWATSRSACARPSSSATASVATSARSSRATRRTASGRTRWRCRR